jgi:DNA-binding response OmpR family regulator
VAVASDGTVLVVEDDDSIRGLVETALTSSGFDVVTAADGEQGLELAERRHPDLVVLDIGLPGVDGLEVIRQLRGRSGVPVIFLTARSDEIDRILSFELGADDYLTKPFSPRELTSRVRAVLRRTKPDRQGGEEHEIGRPTADVVVDVARREVRINGDVVPFTSTQFELLLFLARHRNQAITREQLLAHVWGRHDTEGSRTVDVHIGQVRRKLDDRAVIATVRGVGYRLD